MTALWTCLWITCAATQSSPDPDALYARRDTGSNAQQAARIWEGRLAANPRDFEAAWKLARARYWLGGHASPQGAKAIFQAGVAAGRAAAALMPDKPEGHFWAAANMGALAESFGLRQGLKYRGAIKDELETVLRLDPAFQEGSADRALGRWYFKVPGLFGGSNRKSEEHLRKALTYNPNSTATLYFLAETLLDMKRKDEARAALDKLIAVPEDPEWAPEDREFKQKAQRLLERSLASTGQTPRVVAYSDRSAAAGSTRTARRAGTNAATAATVINASTPEPIVAGSPGVTP